MIKTAIVSIGFSLTILSAARAECSTNTLQGQYIFSAIGFIEPLAPDVRRVHSGLLVFDGTANVSGMETSSRAGRIAREQRLKGSYTLNADCSGTVTLDSLALPNLQTHWDLFVTADGNKVNMIRTDPGSMSVRRLER
jgi:hypothetical protein